METRRPGQAWRVTAESLSPEDGAAHLAGSQVCQEVPWASSKGTGGPVVKLAEGQSQEGPATVERPASQRGQGVPT